MQFYMKYHHTIRQDCCVVYIGVYSCLISITCSLAKVARLFDPERFDPSKLTVRYDNGANVVKGKSFEDLLPRKYTLTHSDITGELLLSVGPSFNRLQVSLTCKLGIVFKLGLGH